MLAQFAGGYFSDEFGGEVILPLTSVIWGLVTISFVLMLLSLLK